MLEYMLFSSPDIAARSDGYHSTDKKSLPFRTRCRNPNPRSRRPSRMSSSGRSDNARMVPMRS